MLKFDIFKNACINANDYLLKLLEKISGDQDKFKDLDIRLFHLENYLKSTDDKIKENCKDIKQDMDMVFGIIQNLEDIRPSFKVFYCVLKNMFDAMDDQDYDTDIDVADWIVESINEQSYGNLIYTNSDDLSHEMMLIDTSNISEAERFLNTYANENLCFRLICYYDTERVHEYEWLLIRKKEPNEPITIEENCLAFLKMCEVYNGKTHISPINYQYASPTITRCFNPSLDYRQNEEIVEVMDECNYQKSLIDRYLRLYHALEYYAYKYRICEMVNSAQYSRLSVRNFRYLSETLEKKEKETLKEFMYRCYDVRCGTQKMGDQIFSIWDLNGRQSGNTVHVEKTMDLLGILKTASGNNKVTEFNIGQKNSMNQLIVDLIYQIRCSIVHNKVNEYHITYSNINNDIEIVLEKILLPIMELFIYGLMFDDDTITVYRNQTLNLY